MAVRKGISLNKKKINVPSPTIEWPKFALCGQSSLSASASRFEFTHRASGIKYFVPTIEMAGPMDMRNMMPFAEYFNQCNRTYARKLPMFVVKYPKEKLPKATFELYKSHTDYGWNTGKCNKIFDINRMCSPTFLSIPHSVHMDRSNDCAYYNMTPLATLGEKEFSQMTGLEDLKHPLGPLSNFRPEWESISTSAFIFSQKGHVLGYHREDILAGSLNLLIHGRKRWLVIARSCNENIRPIFRKLAEASLRGTGYSLEPCGDVAQHKGFYYNLDKLAKEQGSKSKVKWFEFVQEPGDVVLISPDAYHQVIVEEDSCAVAFNYIDSEWLNLSTAVLDAQCQCPQYNTVENRNNNIASLRELYGIQVNCFARCQQLGLTIPSVDNNFEYSKDRIEKCIISQKDIMETSDAPSQPPLLIQESNDMQIWNSKKRKYSTNVVYEKVDLEFQCKTCKMFRRYRAETEECCPIYCKKCGKKFTRTFCLTRHNEKPCNKKRAKYHKDEEDEADEEEKDISEWEKDEDKMKKKMKLLKKIKNKKVVREEGEMGTKKKKKNTKLEVKKLKETKMKSKQMKTTKLENKKFKLLQMKKKTLGEELTNNKKNSNKD